MTLYPKQVIHWSPGYRIIPSRFPSIYLYDRVADQDEFDLLNELESMTNARLRDECGDLQMVPTDERIFGNGSGPIMSAFTHLNPMGSRFSDGTYGVFYAAKERETAIAETRHHSENFLRQTNQEPIYLQMRLYNVQVKGEIISLMQEKNCSPDIFDKNSYSHSQAIGKSIRHSGAHGLTYPSVRHEGGECLAAFKTTLLKECLHAAYLEYHWDGKKINYVTEKIG